MILVIRTLVICYLVHESIILRLIFIFLYVNWKNITNIATLKAHGNDYLGKYKVGILCLKVVSFSIKMLHRKQHSWYENMVKIISMVWVTLFYLV